MEGSGSAWAKEKAINEAGARREGCWWGREETRTGWRYGLLNKPQAQPRGKEEKCQSLVRECISVCTYYEYMCIFCVVVLLHLFSQSVDILAKRKVNV